MLQATERDLDKVLVAIQRNKRRLIGNVAGSPTPCRPGRGLWYVAPHGNG